MEEAADLVNDLPFSFKTRSEQEYIEFLWDASETNHTHGKYHFAFLAYYMLALVAANRSPPSSRKSRPPSPASGVMKVGRQMQAIALSGAVRGICWSFR